MATNKYGGKYTGSWFEDKFHGIGTYKNKFGDRVESEWKHGLKHGKATSYQ